MIQFLNRLSHQAVFSDVINDVSEIYKLVAGHTAIQVGKNNFSP